MSTYIYISWLPKFFLEVLLNGIDVADKLRFLNVFLNNIFSPELLGKILSDDTALKEYKIDEKNFVVVMVTKVSFTFTLSLRLESSQKQ